MLSFTIFISQFYTFMATVFDAFVLLPDFVHFFKARARATSCALWHGKMPF